MRWEELTAPRFAQAVKEVDSVCVLPMGVIEKHGEHMPLGTDQYTATLLATKAAELEPAIVFPPYYLSQIHEAKHQPGTIAIGYQLMFDLLIEVCQEISRNGLKKIIILNTHGGNKGFLEHFARSTRERRCDYVVYVLFGAQRKPIAEPQWQKMKQSTVDGHAGEEETSVLLTGFPELVHMDQIAGDGMPRHRLDHLEGLVTGMAWYADFPDHYAGDGADGTREKGRYLLDYGIKKTAEYIKIVKADAAGPALNREFHDRTYRPLAPRAR